MIPGEIGPLACVPCDPEWEMQKIAKAAGQLDPEKLFYNPATGELCVEDVSQAALEAAIASYDHLAVVKARKRKELRRAHEQDYRDIFEIEEEFQSNEVHWLMLRMARQGEANLPNTDKNKLAQMDALRQKLMGGGGGKIGLIDLVNAATTVEEVEAIEWE